MNGRRSLPRHLTLQLLPALAAGWLSACSPSDSAEPRSGAPAGGTSGGFDPGTAGSAAMGAAAGATSGVGGACGQCATGGLSESGRAGTGGVSPTAGTSGGDAQGGVSPGGSASGALAGSAGASGAGGGTSAGGSNAGGTSAGGTNAGGAGAAGTVAGGGQAGEPPDPGTEGDGDFEIGPNYATQPELTDRGAPRGQRFELSMDLRDSAIFDGSDATLDPNKPVTTTRTISVYVPAQYQDGTPAPLLVIQDGPGELALVENALDNLTIAEDPARRIPPFIAVAVQNGGSDAKGSERGLEYDTMSDRYARFIHLEVLPRVAADPAIRAQYPAFSFTDDPQGRATLGCSSGGAAALTMGWFRPDLFGRIITYSGTFVDQQDDDAAEEEAYPLGAWEYHSSLALIASSEKKPLRIFLNVNENDLGANDPESTHHNWVMANERTAAALAEKGYHYRYVFGRGSGHCDGRVRSATLADALIWVWRGYRAPG